MESIPPYDKTYSGHVSLRDLDTVHKKSYSSVIKLFPRNVF